MAKKKTAKRTARKKVAKTSTARKKTTARAGARTTTRTTTRTAAAAAAGPKPLKLAVADRPRSKSEIFSLLAEGAGISKKEVAAVFDGMSQIFKKDLSRSGPGAVNLGGFMKVVAQRKPATKAYTKADPFNPGQMMKVKAKPARTVVKVRPMKALKDLV